MPKKNPNCNESSLKVDSKFCPKCRMVLSYNAYVETVEETQKQKDSEIQLLHKKYETDMKDMREQMENKFSQIIAMNQENPKLARVKPERLAS